MEIRGSDARIGAQRSGGYVYKGKSLGAGGCGAEGGREREGENGRGKRRERSWGRGHVEEEKDERVAFVAIEMASFLSCGMWNL